MKRFAVILSLVLVAACKEQFADKPDARVRDAQAPVVSETTTASAASQQVTSTLPVIKERSRIGFIGAKAVGQHVGVFRNFDGRVSLNGTTPVRIDFEIDPASVKTDAERLDKHLQTGDFFDVANHPRATFTSSSITPAPPGTGGGSTHTITGVLDLRGVKKEVTFPVKVEQTPEGIHATSEFTINRHDWNVSFKGAPDNLIKDEVLMQLDMWFPPVGPA